MLGSRTFWKSALVAGSIALLCSASVAEAKPRVRVRTGHSTRVTYTTNSCAPSYSSHRSHRSYGSYGNHHSHRDYGRSHKRSHSGFSIRIGGSYGSRSGCYDYGYTSRRPSYTYSRTRPSYSYSYGGCTPVYQTTYSYRPVVIDTTPRYAPTYTTTSSDSYRDWQATTHVARTEQVVERPSAPLLPEEDFDRYEGRLRDAQAVLDRREAELQRREADLARRAVAEDEWQITTPTDNDEPPLGVGSTPTSAEEEFTPSEPDELAQAWRALLDDDAATARVLFADAARVMPKKGEARMGYVIASLRAGDRRAASLSMVRLLESEPQLVRGGTLPSGDTLREELDRQVETLKLYEDDSVKAYERYLLIAFVDLLRGETEEAQEAMRRSREAGSEGIAARNLWRLVGLSDKPLERLVSH